MDKLNLIQIFLLVARQGSFAAAATHLGVDPSTVSKAIQQLEMHLQMRLFNRTTRKLHLTDAGKTYKGQCSDLLDKLEACEQQLHTDQHQPKGKLKINLPVAYGQLYIMPIIHRFYERYPEISLDISLTDDYIDMISHSIDIAIRSGQLQDSRLVAKKLSPMDFATFAAPSFLNDQKTINNRNIESMPWILYRFLHTGRTMPIYGVKKQGNKKELFEISPTPVLTVSDGLAMVTACKAGLGLIQAPHFLVRQALISGELEQVQTYYRSEHFNVYAYYSQRGYVPQKVKVFLDFIHEELAAIGENHSATFLSNI